MNKLGVKTVHMKSYVHFIEDYILHQEIKKVQLSEDLKLRLMLLVGYHILPTQKMQPKLERAKSMEMSEAEISSFLEGDFAHSPQSQRKSLAFAHHYAQTHGNYSESVYIDYVHQVGCAMACAISKYLKKQMVIMTKQNATHALIQRLLGYPMATSSIAHELGVITAGLWVYPTVYAKKVWSLSKR